MSLKVRIQDDVRNAMRARDRARLGVLRLITAAIKQKEVDERAEVDDTAVLAVLDKMAKLQAEIFLMLGAAAPAAVAAGTTARLTCLAVHAVSTTRPRSNSSFSGEASKRGLKDKLKRKRARSRSRSGSGV